MLQSVRSMQTSSSGIGTEADAVGGYCLCAVRRLTGRAVFPDPRAEVDRVTVVLEADLIQ